MITVILWYTYKTVKECKRIAGCGEFWKMAVSLIIVIITNNYYKIMLINAYRYYLPT